MLKYRLTILILLSLLLGCAPCKKYHPAPIADGWRMQSAGKSAYIVQRHDTLYSIAWTFGLDYRDLATYNHISKPYALKTGQRIYIAKPATTAKKYVSHWVAAKKYLHEVHEHFVASNQKIKYWQWPAAGKVISRFDNQIRGNKGIDIAGVYGEPIYSCAPGKVVYSGNGIRSYGNLLIIKHNDDYLSAYANNKRMLVREGQSVTTQQKIAEMGYNDAGRTQLHFEIRHMGKPVNPLLYLSHKPARK